MSNRVNVEEIFKNSDGEYYGMESGKCYYAGEFEKIGPFYWSKPAHGADVNELDTTPDDQDRDWKKSGAC